MCLHLNIFFVVVWFSFFLFPFLFSEYEWCYGSTAQTTDRLGCKCKIHWCSSVWIYTRMHSIWSITSHTYHWAETESITPVDIFSLPTKEPSSAGCLFPLLSFLPLNLRISLRYPKKVSLCPQLVYSTQQNRNPGI